MATPSEPRRTAFICAMPMELRPLARKLSLHRTQIGGVSVSSGTLYGREVVAIVTGMGPKLASEATTRLLDAVSVDRVIVVGITRALENVTPIGTLFQFARDVLDWIVLRANEIAPPPQFDDGVLIGRFERPDVHSRITGRRSVTGRATGASTRRSSISAIRTGRPTLRPWPATS